MDQPRPPDPSQALSPLNWPEEIPGRPLVPEAQVYSVPRRFDMASMLTVSLAYSILFAILRALGASWVVFLHLGGLTVAVGVAQALAEHSAQVRKASVITGGSYCVIMGGILLAAAPLTSDDRVYLALCLVTGPGLGYLAGALDGGLFLVADMVRRHLPDGKVEVAGEVPAEEPCVDQGQPD